ncbi:MAG: radical SAM protein [Planctomycetes bacterium]|nr:radical SAM protein [Planctomycetota bacterium]
MGLLGRILGAATTRVWRAEQQLMQRLGLVAPPVAIQWIATNACELECPHCYSRAGRRLVGELDLDEARTLLLDELVALDRPELVLAGGEPLLRPDFAELIEALAERGLGWSLHTHGARVPALRRVFERWPPDMVAVSFDGPPAEHDRFRGRPGSFARAMEAIAILREIGVREVVAGTTVHRGNADLLDRMLPHFLASGAQAWGLHLVTPEGRAGEQTGIRPSAAQLRRVAAFARRARAFIRVELDNEWGSAGELDPLHRDSSFLCGAGRISAVVSATGELMPCTTTDRRESAGSIRERALGDLWRQGFAAFRNAKPGGDKDPLDCWLQTRNGCSCRASAFDPVDVEARLRALAEAAS